MAIDFSGFTQKIMRKQPLQARAQQTIETIFEATAQIIETDGEQAVTTNKVAQKAGFSIGTLYQYFPTKEAILNAMLKRVQKQAVAQIQAILDNGLKNNLSSHKVLQEIVHSLIAFHLNSPRLNSVLVKFAYLEDTEESLIQAMREVSDLILQGLSQTNDPLLKKMSSPITMYITVRALIGTLRSTIIERSPLINTQEYEDELVRMIWGFCSGGGVEVPNHLE